MRPQPDSPVSDTRDVRTVDATRWWALAVISLAQLMVVLDATVVNIALPWAQADLGMSDSGRQWVITSYTLAFGGLLLLGGRISDRIGPKRVFIWGTVGFAIASFLCGAAVSPAMLYTGRVLQGVFAAGLAPAALSLLTLTFAHPEERGKAFGVFGAVSGAGAAVGLLAGGVLTQFFDWRWCLYALVPIAAVALSGSRFLPSDEHGERSQAIDVTGAVFGCAGLVAIVYGFNLAYLSGWSGLDVMAFLGGGILVLAAFAFHQARASNPLLPLIVLTERNRAGSFIAVGLANIAMYGLFLFMTYYMQVTLDYTPLQAGLAFVPLSVSIVAGASLLAGRFLPYVQPRLIMVPALLSAALGMYILTFLTADMANAYLMYLLPAQILLGLGLGGVMMPAMATATSKIEPENAGAASAMVNASQQIGGSLGIALLNTVALTATAGYVLENGETVRASTDGTVYGYTQALMVAAFILVCAAIITFVLVNAKAPRRRHAA